MSFVLFWTTKMLSNANNAPWFGDNVGFVSYK
jgi:hypothetical protein